MKKTFWNKNITLSGMLFTMLYLFVPASQAAATQGSPTLEEVQCRLNGWKPETVRAAGLTRALLWKPPLGRWRNGAIIVMHGGGGRHVDFCTGGTLVQPQIAFTRQAVKQGFAVFLLDSTNDVVTDAAGRKCGKRFDFSVLNRPNIDLPFINKVITNIIPRLRPSASSRKIFITGLSTGGYMTIRAGSQLDDKITAFVPVSAGDPYGTETNCDTSLSNRTSAKGILTDLETGKQITEIGACISLSYPNEHHWLTGIPILKPAFKQFHSTGDGIVDLSCMKKAQIQLRIRGYKDAGPFILRATQRNVYYHLWLNNYNQPILDFFKSR